MKTKQLNPQQLGSKEDWEGNNIAFACPLCETVYIVSEQIHSGERKCPACGKSRGLVTGGRKQSGSTASIVWEDAPVFVLGRKYSREKISGVLGGGEIDFLPTEKKQVVCGCFTLDHNPEAPAVVKEVSPEYLH